MVLVCSPHIVEYASTLSKEVQAALESRGLSFHPNGVNCLSEGKPMGKLEITLDEVTWKHVTDSLRIFIEETSNRNAWLNAQLALQLLTVQLEIANKKNVQQTIDYGG